MLPAFRSPFTVSDKTMTITNIILTSQRRPYKYELQKLQLKIWNINMSWHKWKVLHHWRRCVTINEQIKCKIKLFKTKRIDSLVNIIVNLNRSVPLTCVSVSVSVSVSGSVLFRFDILVGFILLIIWWAETETETETETQVRGILLMNIPRIGDP